MRVELKACTVANALTSLSRHDETLEDESYSPSLNTLAPYG